MRGKRNSNISPNPKDEISWQKNTLRTKLLIQLTLIGIVMELGLGVILLRPYTLFWIIMTLIALMIYFIVICIFIMLMDMSFRSPPSLVGISKTGIYFKHGKTVDYIPWKNVKEIIELKYPTGIRKHRVQKGWALFLKDGGVRYMDFITRDIIKDMLNEFERYNLREKTK